MNKKLLLSFILSLCGNVFAQYDLQKMYGAETSFEQTAAESGMKTAFLKFLAVDGIVFRPNPINGIDFWTLNKKNGSPLILVRNSNFGDISANGLMGYTTGSWQSYPKGKRDTLSKFGQFVTIWEKKPDGTFRASLDIDITHDEPPVSEAGQGFQTDLQHDPNKRGYSPADASMNFLRMGMTTKALGNGYKQYAVDNVRLLLDGKPLILGKKNVVSEMSRYTSINFPKKVALYQAADLAYVWNACEFANSKEGTEKGNCLHIWKLRDKKWWIVLGVFARVTDDTPPELKTKPKSKE
ncbi:MAG: hypothetical protein ABIP78_06445 [Pyrinomonadaceae bacterium]